MNESLKVGDKVRLNCGGLVPRMTVVSIGESGCCCKYFHEGEFKTSWFPEAALERL